MKRQIKVTVNGKPYEVSVGDLTTSPVEVTVNGKAYSVSLDEMLTGSAAPAPGPASVAPPAVQVQAPVVQPAPRPQPQAAGSNGAGNDIRSPMPGVILDIQVKPGDHVQPGQQICALEAMKMKSAIRSAREGTIASVEVSDGQKVAYGDVIIRFQ
jgi:biotin carboxyl carrier protein